MRNDRERRARLPAPALTGVGWGALGTTPNAVELSVTFDMGWKRYFAYFTPIKTNDEGGFEALIPDPLMGRVPLMTSPRFNAKVLDSLWLAVQTAGAGVVKALEAGDKPAAIAAIDTAVLL